MALLLVGCETTLYLASRLRVYIEFLQKLDASPSRHNLEITVVKLFAHILSFLAQAIRTYQASSIRRMLSSVWTDSNVTTFEKTCYDLAQQAEIEASNCDRARQEDMLEILKELRDFRHFDVRLDRLEIDTKLDKIPVAAGAMFDSYDSIHRLCHPGTRVELLNSIRDWTNQPDGKIIFWLSGQAGTGKSTISWTIAKELSEQTDRVDVGLGATFFFRRGEGDRGSASRFFSTIVRQLIINIPVMDGPVARAIRRDPLIFEKALSEQFKRLILDPLTTVDLGHDYIVVVDALDECEKQKAIETILSLWSLMPHGHLKLFLTSRPELPIRLGFASMSADRHHDVLLQEAVPSSTLLHDLAVYVGDGLRQIRIRHNACSLETLDDQWCDENTIGRLVRLSDPLFIVAATILRFVGDLDWEPQERLAEILGQRSTGQMSQMERAYLPVLNHIMAKSQDSDDQERIREQFEAIIGSIVCLVEPLSVASIATLINIHKGIVSRRLDPLHSVLLIPSDKDSPVRTLHLSFTEFLLARGRRNQPFGIDGPKMHQTLKDHCLRLLSSRLRANICNLEDPGQLRKEIDPQVLATCFQPALQYACRYWVHHLKESQITIQDNDRAHLFLQEHFLHWLEALSLIDCLAEAISFVETLLQLCLSGSSASIKVSSLLEDARRFVLANRLIIDLVPNQVYLSAVVFAPQFSKVKVVCGRLPRWLLQHPLSPPSWGPELQRLEGHEGEVTAVAFSLDGSLLASGSRDQTIGLWNAKTGQEMQELRGHEGMICSVAFLLDGCRLISGSQDGTMRFWDLRTGQVIQKINRFSPFAADAVSSSGSLFASVSAGNKIALRDIRNGQASQTLQAHCDEISAVVFSPDGSLLVSGSRDHTVQIWNVNTGRKTQTLVHKDKVESVIFSPDGTLLASGTFNHVHIWGLGSHQRYQMLQDDSAPKVVAFSPDSSILASALAVYEIRLWSIKTGQLIQTLYGHDNRILAPQFSSNSILASGSWDQTIRLWDVKVDQEVERLKGDDKKINTLIFSPDASRLVSRIDCHAACLWDTKTGQRISTLSEVSIFARLVFSPDSSLLALGSRYHKIRLFDTKIGRHVQTIGKSVGGSVPRVTFSHDCSLLASVSRNFSIRIWDIESGHLVQSMYPLNKAHEDDKGKLLESLEIAFSPDDSFLAFRPEGHPTCLWNIRTGQLVQSFDNVSAAEGLKFADDGQSLITNRETIESDSGSLNSESKPWDSIVYQNDDWIRSGDTKLVWLPREYRGTYSAFHCGILAIAQNSGIVGFWHIASPLLLKGAHEHRMDGMFTA